MNFLKPDRLLSDYILYCGTKSFVHIDYVHIYSYIDKIFYALLKAFVHLIFFALFAKADITILSPKETQEGSFWCYCVQLGGFPTEVHKVNGQLVQFVNNGYFLLFYQNSKKIQTNLNTKYNSCDQEIIVKYSFIMKELHLLFPHKFFFYQ